MSRTLQFRRYPSSQLASITGANGEIIINTTTRSITVHDGVTPGGYTPTAVGSDQVARDTANSSLSLAQNAYNYANTIVSDTQIDPYARTTANNASNNISILQGVDATQNTRLNSIETINGNQNTSISVIQGVDVTQNTRLNSIETINGNQNTSISIIQGVDITQNTRIQSIETINTNQNNSITIIQGVDATQNTRLNSIETINGNQNTSISILQGVNTTQNNNITYVNQFAQSAYDKANTAGSTGNYTFTGNTITLTSNASANLTVSESAQVLTPVTYTRNPDADSDNGHFDYVNIDVDAKTITFQTYGGASLITAVLAAYNNGATINVAYDGTDTYNITPGITKYGDIVLTSFTNTSGPTWVGTYNETLTPLTNSTRVFILSWNALSDGFFEHHYDFGKNGTLTLPGNINSIQNVVLTANSAGTTKSWNFATDGTLTLPSQGFFSESGLSVKTGSNELFGIKTWSYENNGDIRLPDGRGYITSLSGGDLRLLNNDVDESAILSWQGGEVLPVGGGSISNFLVNSSGATVSLTTNGGTDWKNWVFDTSGNLTAPGTVSSTVMKTGFTEMSNGAISTTGKPFYVTGYGTEGIRAQILLNPSGGGSSILYSLDGGFDWIFTGSGVTFPDSTTQTGASISITELKALVANAATYADFQTAIAAL